MPGRLKYPVARILLLCLMATPVYAQSEAHPNHCREMIAKFANYNFKGFNGYFLVYTPMPLPRKEIGRLFQWRDEMRTELATVSPESPRAAELQQDLKNLRDAFVLSNMDILDRWASFYGRRTKGAFTGDLVDEGALVVMKAYEDYDLSKGSNFREFSERRIQAWFYQWWANHFYPVKLGRVAFHKARRPPVDGESSRITHARQVVAMSSIDASIRQSQEETGEPLTAHAGLYSRENDPRENSARSEFSEQLAKIVSIAALTEKQRQVLYLRYVKGLTLAATGEAMGGVTREAARLNEVNALKKLRETMELMNFDF